MSAEHDTRSGYVGEGIGWPIGGAVGGALGAAAFGILMWTVDPEVVSATIPSVYGLEPASVTGWAIHLAHGAVLGVVFGFVVSRPSVLGVVAADAETEAVSRTGLIARVAGAGFAYGLAIWAILPVLVLPVWTGAIGTSEGGEFPTVAVESMVGHALFGIILGVVLALAIDRSSREIANTLEE